MLSANQIFPRLVWAYIYQFLSYIDRYHFRLLCRYTRTFKNNEPMAYWLRRNDPICLNLGNLLSVYQVKYGVSIKYITFNEIYIYQYITGVFKGGDTEVFKYINHGRREIDIYKYTAIKYGTTHLIEEARKLEPEAFSYHRFDKCDCYEGKFSENYNMYYVLRFNGEIPEHFNWNTLNKDHLHYSMLKYAVYSNKPRAVQYIINKFNISSFSVFYLACKKNHDECALVLLNYLNYYSLFYSSNRGLRDIMKMKNKSILWQFFQKISKNELTMGIKEAIKYGHFHAIKKLIEMLH